MNKKEYVQPATSVVHVKIEGLMIIDSGGDAFARESGDLDFEEFEEEAGESSSNWNK